MIRLTSILCPIDFSELSVRAYDYAQSLASHYKADLLVLHVRYSIPAFYMDAAYRETVRELRADALRKLREFAKRQTRTNAQPQCVVKDGIVADQILSFAQAQAVNMIVMGTHGTRGVDRVMLGSATEKVLRKARCPVLSVPKPANDSVTAEGNADPISPKRIVLAMDFSEPAHRALNYAFSFAKQYNAELTLVHVLEHFPSSVGLQSASSKAMRQLRELVPPGPSKTSVVKFLVRIGKPYEQIVALAFETQADLVIMGVRGHGSVNSAIFGSTAYRVIQLGPCPVLAVHT
jgi:nucleotide-binding universal stress UspA family protein